MITVKKHAIKYKDSDGTMKDSGVLCQVGTFGVDWFPYMNIFENAFKRVVFPKNTEITLNIGKEGWIPQNVTQYSLQSIFANTTGVTKVVLKGNPENVLLKFRYAFESSEDLEEVDISGLNLIVQDFLCAFNVCKKLKRIIGELDFSNATHINSMFSSCIALEEVRFKSESLFTTLQIPHTSVLSDESIQSIINGLATVEESQTIAFHVNVKAKLTEEQIATITSKNWTLA